ncbi:unnamed protein product, partial [Linum tenue]
FLPHLHIHRLPNLHLSRLQPPFLPCHVLSPSRSPLRLPPPLNPTPWWKRNDEIGFGRSQRRPSLSLSRLGKGRNSQMELKATGGKREAKARMGMVVVVYHRY